MALRVRFGPRNLGKPQGETARLLDLPGLVGGIAGHSPRSNRPSDGHEGSLLPTVSGESFGRNQTGLIGDRAIAVIAAATRAQECQETDRSKWLHEA